jgi:hypothetical protein
VHTSLRKPPWSTPDPKWEHRPYPGEAALSDIDPDNLRLLNFGYQLLLPAVFYPDANFGRVDFAKVIYDYSNRVSSSKDPLSPTAMVNATRESFQAVFSVTANTY